MCKTKKILGLYNVICYTIGGFYALSLILVVPKIANPFVTGLFTTLGGSIPLLLIIYFFHYLPIKREDMASVPALE